MSTRHYVQVAFPIPISNLFTYVIPDNLVGSVQRGSHVVAFLGRRKLSGIAVGFEPREDLPRVRLIHSLVRPDPVFDQDMLELTREVADYYICPWGEVLAAAYPAHAQKVWRAPAGVTSEPSVYPDSASLDPVSTGTAGPDSGESDSAPEYGGSRSSNSGAGGVDPGTGLSSGEMEKELAEYFKLLLWSSADRKGNSFVLHLPDEMRENMYPFLASETVKSGNSILFLIPEVSTSSSLIGLLAKRFGREMALFHSRLKISERKRIWEDCRIGKLKVLVGTRSAVFLPVLDLGLIVVDDEHARPYKQEETPRYNGRDVAVMRSKLTRVPVLLGSATPSVESVLAIERGEAHLLKGTPVPKEKPGIRLVDMRARANATPGAEELSLPLVSAIRDALGARKRTLLFLNRRGFSTWVQCQECGALQKCPICGLPSVFHLREKKLFCHRCGRKDNAPSTCERCGGVRFRFGGVGVEKLQDRLEKLFPEARVARVDLDSARSRPEAVKMAKQFADGELDILIGTIFVLKGLELGRFSLAGMLQAESQLNVPDFRSGERAFQLLSEIVSLAQNAGAEVVIQTLNPDHHSVVSVCTEDAGRFYDAELQQRRELGYPPFSTLVAFHVSGPKESEVTKIVERLRSFASSGEGSSEAGDIQILGPSPAIPAKMRGRFRWYMSLRGEDRDRVTGAARALLAELGGKHEIGGVTVSVDVDPVGG